MKLAQLAHDTATPPATIKYWMRMGFVPHGVKRNATTADYGEAHVERVRLVAFLRTVLDTDSDAIRSITELLDDPATKRLDLLEACQTLATGLPIEPNPDAADDAVITELCDAVGWPNTGSVARAQLATTIASCRAAGRPVDVDDLVQYGRAFAPLAQANVLDTALHGNPDQVALRVIRGIVLSAQLERAVSNLAHASASMDLIGQTPARVEMR